MAGTNNFNFLLKEINDPYVQENFYRLKLILDRLIDSGLLGTPQTVTQIITGGSSTPPVPGTVSLRKVMGCAATVTVGNWVYQSDSTNNFAIAATNNSPAKPVIGIVVAKPSSMQCEVMYLGITPVVVGRGQLYLGATGNTVNAAPVSGHVQKLGYSFGDGEILVRPEWTRILLT